jgi:hypothetical protein
MKDSFVETLKYKLMLEGRMREIADQKNQPYKHKSDWELVEEIFTELGWQKKS